MQPTRAHSNPSYDDDEPVQPVTGDVQDILSGPSLSLLSSSLINI